MKKHNNIQDRIKLLMEYDTSKTYSENKELINEGLKEILAQRITALAQRTPAWALRLITFFKNRYLKKNMTQAEWKQKFIENWVENFSNPSLVANALEKAKFKDSSSKIKDLLDEIELIEKEIVEYMALKKTPGITDANMVKHENQLNDSIGLFLDKHATLFKEYYNGLTQLSQINSQYGIRINSSSFVDEIEDVATQIAYPTFNQSQFNTINKKINNVYTKFNQQVTSQANSTQQKWGLWITLLTVTNWIADFQIIGKWLFENFLNTVDINLLGYNLRTDSRLKFIIPSYCSAKTTCNPSSNICKYTKLIGENLNQNQITLLYTLIYGVLTKKPILGNTQSADFCYLLRKYKTTIVNFDKNEKELKQSILLSIDAYRTTKPELFKLFIDVWVKDNKLNINFNVIENIDKQIESFLISKSTQIESKIINNSFKQKISEQQTKPNQQLKLDQQQKPIQSSVTGFAAAGALLSKLIKVIPWSYLKEIWDKSGGKIWGRVGVIAFILSNINITEKVLDAVISVLSETKSNAFLKLFNSGCNKKQKQRRSNKSLDLYVSLFNDRVLFETWFPNLKNKNINMALWVIFGDYVNNTNLFNMGDLCYINTKTKGKFAEDFQKFYNNLPNLTIEQFKSKSVQNLNTLDKIWNKSWATYNTAGLGGVFNKIWNINKKDEDGRFTEVEVLNELSGFKKIDVNLMMRYYLQNKVNTPNTNNLGDENFSI